MRRLAPLVAAAAVALVAGCGGDGDAATGAADVAPASAAAYVSIDTDFEGDQWQRAEDILQRFPGGRDAIRSFLGELESEDLDFERDVKPAVGPEIAIVWLDLEDDDAVVALTQPRDEAKFQELLQKADEPTVSAQIDEWTAVAESQEILDRFETAREGDSLADADTFEDATEDLPEDALAVAYASGEALTSQVNENAGTTPEERAVMDCFLDDGSVPALGMAVSAEEEGVRFVVGGAHGDEDAPERGESELAGELPAGATSFVSMNGLGETLRERIRCVADANEDAARMIAQVELGLGVSLDEDVLPLFEGETAIASYPSGSADLTQDAAGSVPAAVVVTEVEDEARALEVVDKIAARASAFVDGVDVQDATIAGVEAKQVTIRGQTSLFYAAFEGKLVLSSTDAGLAGVAGDEDALADDERYTGARDASGAPGETTGLAFLDLAAIVAEYGGLGAPLPPGTEENLEPLRSLLLWGDVGDDRFSVEGFLQID